MGDFAHLLRYYDYQGPKVCSACTWCDKSFNLFWCENLKKNVHATDSCASFWYDSKKDQSKRPEIEDD